jgi:eukaryotic-like serine/threonine-protein kinase
MADEELIKRLFYQWQGARDEGRDLKPEELAQDPEVVEALTKLIRLELLVERWDESLDTETELSAEELCINDPDLLAPLTRRIRALKRTDGFLRSDGSETISIPQLQEVMKQTRYEPARFHAKGGLGEVFVAKDRELNREVALKRIRDDKTGDDPRRRFVVEAELTASLEHPGIVPVYGMGQDADDNPFYAMRFIKEPSLADAIREYHKAANSRFEPGKERTLQALVRSFLAVCKTVGYAHSRGILHRDIKPENIMLGEYGETLLVDWGLARPFHQPVGGDDEAAAGQTLDYDRRVSQTLLGQIKGSPIYMSPEQAGGHAATTASDLYSLGATLYELLTGQPPFSGKQDILSQVKSGAFAPPRQINPSAPAALEAICTKAMRREPHQRYGSAQELADDIERWLDDEPVRAWREPRSVRIRRWIKRHRPLVAAAAAALVVTAVSSWALAIQGYRYAAMERQNVDELRRSKADVDKNFGFAREVIRGITRYAVGDPILRRPGMIVVQQSLLQQTRDYYRNFIANQRPDEPEVQYELALFQFANGMTEFARGHYPEARDEYRRAHGLFQSLAAGARDNQLFNENLVDTSLQLGICECKTGEFDSGVAHIDEAAVGIEQLLRTKPNEPAYRVKRAFVDIVFAQELTRAGRIARAAELWHSVDLLLDGLPETIEQNLKTEAGGALRLVPAVDALLAVALNDVALQRLTAGDLPGAARFNNHAERVAASIMRANPEDANVLWLGYVVKVNRAVVWRTEGRTEEAIGLLETARAGLQSLARESPYSAEFALAWARASFLKVAWLFEAGKLAEVEQLLVDSDRTLRRILQRYPKQRDAQSELSDVCRIHGMILGRQGHPDPAFKALAEARRLSVEIRQSGPLNPEERFSLAAIELAEGNIYMRSKKDAERAEPYFERGRAICEELVATAPNPEYQCGLASAWQNLGMVHVAKHQPLDGLPWLNRACDAFSAVVREYPKNSRYSELHRRCCWILGTSYVLAASDAWRARDVDQSLVLWKKADSLFGPLVRDGFQREAPDIDVQEEYALHLRAFSLGLAAKAGALSETKKYAEALQFREMALATAEKLLATNPHDPANAELGKRARFLLSANCVLRLGEMDVTTPSSRQEARRVAQAGLAALGGLPPEYEKPAVAKFRGALQKQLDSHPQHTR